MSYCPFDFAMMAPRLIVVRERLRKGDRLLRRYESDLAGMTVHDAGFDAACERVAELIIDLSFLRRRISDMEEVMGGIDYQRAIAAYDAARSE
jgi:hypothetical protein